VISRIPHKRENAQTLLLTKPVKKFAADKDERVLPWRIINSRYFKLV